MNQTWVLPRLGHDTQERQLAQHYACRQHDEVHSRSACLANVLLLLPELAVVIIHLLVKALAPVDEVPWVDADLLKAVCHHTGHHWLEVDVCHQRHIIPARQAYPVWH